MSSGRNTADNVESVERNKKRTWNYPTLHDLHVHVNAILRQAMLNERYKRWKKVRKPPLKIPQCS